MARDPYSLFIAIDSQGRAEGYLYLDDGDSFDFRRGARRLRRFTYESGVITSSAASPDKLYAPENTIERIVIAGLDQRPRSALVQASSSAEAREVDVIASASVGTYTVRKPDVKAAYDWTITLQF